MSLVQQTIGIDQIELIFVDDASTDEDATWNMLQEFERAYPESIKILKLEENMRQGGARNVALQYATGEYIAFVDADDFVSENFLLETYEKAKESDADIIQFEYFYYTDRLGAVDSGRNITPEVIEISSVSDRKRFLISEKVTYGCWNKLYRHTLLNEAHTAYAEHVIYEEPLFVYPLLYFANKIIILNDAYYYYRQNDSGTMRNDMRQEETLKMHADVQLAVWNFMKKTPFFKEYYDEIKLYFLHTYLYETLYFAKLRDFKPSYAFYKELEKTVITEVPDYDESTYSALIPKQMELYRMIGEGMTEEKFGGYWERL